MQVTLSSPYVRGSAETVRDLTFDRPIDTERLAELIERRAGLPFFDASSNGLRLTLCVSGDWEASRSAVYGVITDFIGRSRKKTLLFVER